MPENGLYILTGPVQSGKTSSLMNWIVNQTDVYGILTPLVNEKRVFMDAQTRDLFDMEATADESAAMVVGRFRFSRNNFDMAITIIRDAIEKQGWLVIDEIGPLELRGEGFHDVLKEVLAQRKDKLLLVVREGLVEKVKEYFALNAFEMNPGDLYKLHY
jgi:nucleoside-triphosphatase THEP1